MKGPALVFAASAVSSVVIAATMLPTFADGIEGRAKGRGTRVSVFTSETVAKIAETSVTTGVPPRLYFGVDGCRGEVPWERGTTTEDTCLDKDARCATQTGWREVWSVAPGADQSVEGNWRDEGVICPETHLPEDGRVPGVDEIRRAFHDTDFSVPQLILDPPKNRTLVTVPVYLQLDFPEAGFEPQEIDTPDRARFYGYDVDIRPTFRSVTYDHGDGTSTGPTSDWGGEYPDGGITHKYETKGRYSLRADVTYSGEFRIDDGPWHPIPDTVTIDGTEEPMTVLTAKNRLVRR